jgi:hypothetical protein
MHRVARLSLRSNGVHIPGLPIALVPLAVLAPDVSTLHFDDQHSLTRIEQNKIALALRANVPSQSAGIARMQPPKRVNDHDIVRQASKSAKHTLLSLAAMKISR